MMLQGMKTNRLRPRFRQLADKRGVKKMHISQLSGVPYQTVQNYYNSGEDLKGLRLSTLYAFLRGVGFTDKEILDLRLGDLFDIVVSDAE